MINKRLLQEIPETKKHIAKQVSYQIVALLSNVMIIVLLGDIINRLMISELTMGHCIWSLFLICIAIATRFFGTYMASKESHVAAKLVKLKLRTKIYQKLLHIGNAYTKKISTAELLQISVEGVEQLESYFGGYLPQFFYALLAPIILFVVVANIHIQTAIILLCCVPFIPISIICVQKIAKKLLQKYWGEYTVLGDSFLENLQGLTTLKIYRADGYKHDEMNKQAERFRKITMKVLTMQLNSISVMDIIAYGGTAVGIISAVFAYQKQEIMFHNAIVIILLCADFFLPMRLLGSFFHIAMNGVAASNKIFALCDIETFAERENTVEETDILMQDLSFGYEADKDILKQINLKISRNTMVSIVGESGCGKSTIACLIAGIHGGYRGSACIGGYEVSSICEKSLYQSITTIGLGSYIFKGTVKENLLMGKADATTQELWDVLEQVRLKDFLKTQQGLETNLLERGENLSGGQCQRLALARALLHDSQIYIFDEATSNIDLESENEIMEVIKCMKKTKTIILISHRLANVTESDNIYVLDQGRIVETGTHEELLIQNGSYATLWNTQMQLECGIGGTYEAERK